MHSIDSDIRRRLATASLPVMPQVLLKLLAHCESGDASMSALAGLIATDAGLTAKVLDTASSCAGYPADSPVSIELALEKMGIEMLRTLLVTESVYQSFSPSLADQIDLRCFWRHSIGTAIAARQIAGKMGYANTDEAYLSGLLHDIGRLALLSAAPQEYAVNFFHTDDLGLCAVEERTLQTTHTETGAWLIEQFDFDSFMADAIRYHHEPLSRLQDAHPLVRCTAIADLITEQSASPRGLDGLSKLCGIAAAELATIQGAIEREINAVAEQVGIDLADLGAAVPPAEFHNIQTTLSGRDQLRHKVRDFTLVSQVAESFSRYADWNTRLHAIADTAAVLFRLRAVLMMSVDDSRGLLMAHAPRVGRQRIAGLTMPLDEGGALAVAARTMQIMHLVPNAQTTVGEQQLLRFLGAERLIGIPVVHEGKSIGMLIGAVAEQQLPDLMSRDGMLHAFGRQAGAALAQAASVPAAKAFESSIEFQLAAREMAHEVNNPLSIVRNYLAVLERKLGDGQSVQNELGVLNEEIERVDRLVNEFANPENSANESAVDINACIRHVVQLFQVSESLHSAIELVYTESAVEVTAAFERGRLQQVLINLLKNAVEAMPLGGRITVRHHGVVKRDGRPFSLLEVADNGPGIPARVLGGLFQQIRSTKGGSNRGFGLNIVHGMVTKAGGLISCHSDSKGTRFDILLPVISDNSDAALPRSTFRNRDIRA